MRVPFLHPAVQALGFGERCLTWVAATRGRRCLKALDVTHQAIEDGDVAAALTRLMARVRPPHPYVVTHLQAPYLWHVVLVAPFFDDAETFEAWQAAEAARRLPPNARPEDFIRRTVVLEEGEEQIRCLLVLASRHAAEQRLALLAGAGLEPLGLGSTTAALGGTLALNEHGARWAGLLEVRADGSTLITVGEGVLVELTELPYGLATTEAAVLLDETCALLPAGTAPLFVAGEGAGQLLEAARRAPPAGSSVQALGWEAGLIGPAEPVDVADAPTVALALQALFSGLGDVSFLDSETAHAGVQAVERREALRAILALAGAFGLLLVVLSVLHAQLADRRAAASAVLDTLSGELEEMEAARAGIARLEREIRQAERLVVERTDVAGLLGGLGRAVPEALWLDALTIEEAEPGRAQLTLTGATLSEQALARYLERLEQTTPGGDVRLLLSESVTASALYRSAPAADLRLVRFEITVVLLPTEPAA